MKEPAEEETPQESQEELITQEAAPEETAEEPKEA